MVKDHPGARVAVASLDLVDRGSVAKFVEAWSGPLHILVNNGGIMALPEPHRSPEGWELQFATNYLGHVNLTLGLHDALAAAKGARIVSVSSNGHRRSPIIFDDLHFEKRPYEAWAAYGQSKTGNVLPAVAAGTRWTPTTPHGSGTSQPICSGPRRAPCEPMDWTASLPVTTGAVTTAAAPTSGRGHDPGHLPWPASRWR